MGISTEDAVEVPRHWDVRRFSEVARVVKRVNRPELELLSVYLDPGVIRYSESGGQVHKPSLDLSLYQHVQPGDLVLNNQQAWRGSVGVSKYEGIVSPAYVVCELSRQVNPRYANSLFRSPLMVDQMVTASKGVGSIQRNLTMSYLRACKVPLPSLDEQQLIVRYLDHAELRIAKAIAAKQQVLELLRERRQSFVQATVLKGLAPDVDRADTGVSWLGSVPAHWRVVRARECFVERVEKSKEGAEELLSVSQYFGVRPTRQVRKTDSQMLSRATTLVGYKVVLAGDLVVNTMLAWNGSMGASPIDGIVSPAYAVYRPVAGVDTKYFQYLLTTPLLKGVIRAWSSGIQDSRLRLYPNKFFQIAVPLPSFEEQKKISLYLDAQLKSSDEAALAIMSEIALLKEYRTRLISDVVTGKLDVRDEAAKLPEIDPMELATVAVGENGDDEEATDDD